MTTTVHVECFHGNSEFPFFKVTDVQFTISERAAFEHTQSESDLYCIYKRDILFVTFKGSPILSPNYI
jgi:hypothetical protein